MKKLELLFVTGTPEESCAEFLRQALQGPGAMREWFGMDEKAATLCCKALCNILTSGDAFGMDREICQDIADLANVTGKALGRVKEDITAEIVFAKIMEHPAYAPLKCSELTKIKEIVSGRSYINEKGYEIRVVGEGLLEDIAWLPTGHVYDGLTNKVPVVIYRELQPRLEGVDKAIYVKPRYFFLQQVYEMPS